MKKLKESNIKFAANPTDVPSDFLIDLRTLMKYSKLDKNEVINVLHVVLQGKALFWFKTERRNNELRSWRKFKKAFRRQYIKLQDDEDLSCKFIASHLKKPLKEKKLVKIIRENLRPEYYVAL